MYTNVTVKIRNMAIAAATALAPLKLRGAVYK